MRTASRKMTRSQLLSLAVAVSFLAGCSGVDKQETAKVEKAKPAPAYFRVDPATAGSLAGKITFKGRRPTRKRVDMSEDPACVEAHRGAPYDESVVVNPNGTLANVFVYLENGLE